MAAPARAAGPALGKVDARADALFAEEKYLEAAQVWIDALDVVLEAPENRGQRNGWAIGAVNAYEAAFARFRTQCSVILDGISVADRYLAVLFEEYGEQVTRDDDYAGMFARRGELDRLRADEGCPAPTKEVAKLPEPSSMELPGPEELPDGSDSPMKKASGSHGNNPGLAIGTGVSASLMVGMAIGSVVTYMQIRKPDGAAYDKIYQAAVDKMVMNDSKTDICVEGRGVSEVKDACDRWGSLKHAYIATTVLAGVFAVSTAVFAGLLINKRRQSGRRAALFRHHQAHLGAAPQRGGVAFSAGFRF